MNRTKSLFTELNDKNTHDLLCRTPEEFMRSVEVGSRSITDESAMANQFVMAANLLRDAAIKSQVPWFYAHPVLYLYRHAIELHLKGIVRPSKPTHDLIALRNALIARIQTTFGCDITGGWVAETLSDFASIDPDSTRLRYARSNRGHSSFPAEQVVDLGELKTRLDALFIVLMQLRLAMDKPTNDGESSNA